MTASGTASVSAPAESGPRGGPLSGGTLLVHVPFHFVPRRWTYLRDALGALAAYRLAAVSVVVDTNSAEAVALVRSVPTDARFTVRAEVHRDLAHPFELTWAGRRHMANAADGFDYFMYLEDDILVPWEAFESWAAEEATLGERGFVRGFLRVERDGQGRVVATDWAAPLRRPVATEIEGRRYVRPDAFYQACWLASQARLKDFVDGDSWAQGFHRWSSVRRAHRWNRGANYRREFAAFGWSCARPGRPRVLLPVDADGAIAHAAWVWHLPNNYGLDPRQPGGRLAAEELIVGGTVAAASLGGSLAAVAAFAAEVCAWSAFLLRLDVAWRAADGGIRRVARRVRSALVRGSGDAPHDGGAQPPTTAGSPSGEVR
jgi:hypothetical protein